MLFNIKERHKLTTTALLGETSSGVLNRTSLLKGGVEVWRQGSKHQVQTKTMETGITAWHPHPAEGPSRGEEAQLERRLEMAKREPMTTR